LNPFSSRRQVFLAVLTLLLPRLDADAATNVAGITWPGTNSYPNTGKPVPGSQIKWSHPLAAGLVTALPLNEGAGTNFFDAVTQQTYPARHLTGTPAGGLSPAWFTPAVSPTYPWAGPAISNNGAAAQAIQSAAQELDFINNVTVGYSYAVLVQPLDTNTFGRIMDATGAAVITVYLNVANKPAQVATTWRNAAGTAIVPYVPFTVNQWMLVLCTVQQGLGVMYVNGLPVASDANVNLARSWANQTGQVVYNATGNGAMMANANFSSWWVWNNRVLTATEAAQLYAQPWAMFHAGAQKGFLKGTRVTLSQPAVLTHVAFYSHAAAGQIRLGIYGNASPKSLLWQSGAITNTATEAWVTVPITNGTPATVTLGPGTYWLAWQVDTAVDVPSFTAGTSGDGFVADQDFAGFPTALAGERSSSETWSMYFTWVPPPATAPILTRFGFLPGDTFHLQAMGSSNTSYGVLTSTNLTNWLRLWTQSTDANGLLMFSDTNATAFPHRFYRIVSP
jgi:hypothetical protein